MVDCKVSEQVFGQNHLDVNKELGAKVTLWLGITIPRGNPTY